MAKKSIVTSLRLNEDDYLKLKALKEEYGTSWTKLVAHINKILEQEMKDAQSIKDYSDQAVKSVSAK